MAEKLLAARRWKASLLGQKIVMSEASSTGATRSTWVAAPARAVKFPAMRVAETLRGMRRSLSMMWITPLSNSRSWAGLILLILDALKKTWTHGDNDLACSLDTCRHNGILLLIQTN